MPAGVNAPWDLRPSVKIFLGRGKKFKCPTNRGLGLSIIIRFGAVKPWDNIRPDRNRLITESSYGGRRWHAQNLEGCPGCSELTVAASLGTGGFRGHIDKTGW